MAKTDPETTAELWTFGGSRVGANGQRVHAWIGPDGDEMWFKASGSYVVGSVYEAQVVRPEPGKVRRVGHPTYSGRTDDGPLRDALSAKHRAAETTLAVAARERADKRDDPVEQAIDRLCKLAESVPPSQRANFAAYVSYRLAKFWN